LEFPLEAKSLDPDGPGKKFNPFAIPTIDQVLDRGCVIHAGVSDSANVVTALAVQLGVIVDSTLTALPLQPQDQLDTFDSHVRKQIKDLFDQIGWSPKWTEGLDNLSEEMFNHSQGDTKRHEGRPATGISRRVGAPNLLSSHRGQQIRSANEAPKPTRPYSASKTTHGSLARIKLRLAYIPRALKAVMV
jgi:hypothetical protein